MRLLRFLAVMVLVVPLAISSAPGAFAQESYHWLAAGDSFSSGEGIAGTNRNNKGPGGRECARADGSTKALAWGARAFQRLQENDGAYAVQSFVACSGALTDEWSQQVQEARSETGIDDFTIASFSLGGNNIGFGDVLRGCLDIDIRWGDPFGCDEDRATLAERIDMLSGRRPIQSPAYEGTITLPELYAQVANDIEPGGDVFVVGYPQLVEDPQNWAAWRKRFTLDCEGILPRDVGLMRSVVAYLNQAIAEAVAEADVSFASKGVRFHFLDIATSVYERGSERHERHSLCSDESWINGLPVGLDSGGLRLERVFHPKQAGHTATGDALSDLVEDVFTTTDAPAGLTSASQLFIRGIGPIRAGMSVDEAAQVGRVGIQIDDFEIFEGYCYFGSPEGFEGLQFMVIPSGPDPPSRPEEGSIVRVEARSPSWKTVSGLHVGSRVAEVLEIFPDIRVDRHEYSEEGVYLTFEARDAGDRGFGVRFVSEDGDTVSEIFAGETEAISLVEGCL